MHPVRPVNQLHLSSSLSILITLILTSSAVAVDDRDQTPDKTSTGASKPNILFIAVDDLNDWIGCLKGHPQTLTPNIDRLAASGVLFTNAHCPAPACNPSRTAIMTGIAPNKSGLYDNRQKMREVLPNAELIPKHFSRNGYHSSGSGKMLHYFIDADSWDEYYPKNGYRNSCRNSTRSLSSSLAESIVPMNRGLSLGRTIRNSLWNRFKSRRVIVPMISTTCQPPVAGVALTGTLNISRHRDNGKKQSRDTLRPSHLQMRWLVG